MTSAFARSALASFVALHGIAHLVGTTDLWSRAADGRAADLVLGPTSNPLTLRVLALGWALVAVAYALTAAAMWAGRERWPLLLGRVTLASLVLTVVALWASVIGLVIDLALLAIVAVVVHTRGRRAAMNR